MINDLSIDVLPAHQVTQLVADARPHCLSLLHDRGDGVDDAVEAGRFGRQSLPAGGRNPVEAGTPLQVGLSSLGG